MKFEWEVSALEGSSADRVPIVAMSYPVEVFRVGHRLPIRVIDPHEILQWSLVDIFF